MCTLPPKTFWLDNLLKVVVCCSLQSICLAETNDAITYYKSAIQEYDIGDYEQAFTNVCKVTGLNFSVHMGC